MIPSLGSWYGTMGSFQKMSSKSIDLSRAPVLVHVDMYISEHLGVKFSSFFSS